MTNENPMIPNGLKTWFVIHFLADMLFAIPLIFFPEVILPWFGWGAIDPVMPRLVGAALLGIGGESLFSRNASRDAFNSLLRLKIIWASAATLALGLGISKGSPPAAWVFLAIFVGFLGVWVFFWRKLNNPG